MKVKVVIFCVVLFLLLCYAFSSFAAPSISLWIETGRVKYWTNETVALAVSCSDKNGLKEIQLFVANLTKGERQLKESKKLDGQKGIQIYFTFLEKELGMYKYQASIKNSNNEVAFSNEIVLTFTSPPFTPKRGERRYEENGWYRVYADYDQDGVPEWSRPFFTAMLPSLSERDMNGDGFIDINDIVLYNKWMKEHGYCNDGYKLAPKIDVDAHVTHVITWAKIKS